ncbi:MAG: nucleotidyltransferase family protein [Pseudomonadota bacterium]
MKGTVVSAIILSAGYSSRMGAFKPLLQIGNTTLLERSVRLFQSAGVTDIRVVLGYRHADLEAILDRLGVPGVVNDRYDDGMFSSVVAGLRSINPGTTAFFVHPVDIPSVERDTVISLLEAYERGEGDIIYPTFHGRRGHPPLVSTKYKTEIVNRLGPGGLRGVLRQYESRSSNVPVPDKHVLIDLDTPEDYRLILTEYHK